MAHALEAAAGAIYDIGYRNYDGARLGRGYAFRTLYVHSLRTAFGLGRGGRSLIAPWLLFAVICFPATVTVAVAGLSGGAIGNLIPYHNYFQFVAMMLALFCAAQAPELVSNDQHNRVLPLYFSRALRKHDYAAAKLLAMWTAVFILVFTPLMIILSGRLGLPADFGAALKAESKHFDALVVTPVVAALVMGTIALALASLVSRRGIASAMVLGLFLMTTPLAAILVQAVEAKWGNYGVLLNPVLTANGAILALFGERPGRGDLLRQADLPPEAYAAGVAVYGILFTLLLLNRYRRLSA
jgi:ABC-2 type transport system permease protein